MEAVAFLGMLTRLTYRASIRVYRRGFPVGSIHTSKFGADSMTVTVLGTALSPFVLVTLALSPLQLGIITAFGGVGGLWVRRPPVPAAGDLALAVVQPRRARNAGFAAHDDAWDLQVALMEHLEGNWNQPDNGLWEMRGARRHFTHSKVMAWVAADRMATAVRTHPDLHGPADRWEALRDTIHTDVLTHGYDADRNTFTQSYGAPGLDASLLMIPRVGFLPPPIRGCWAPSPPSATA